MVCPPAEQNKSYKNKNTEALPAVLRLEPSGLTKTNSHLIIVSSKVAGIQHARFAEQGVERAIISLNHFKVQKF